MVSKVTSFKLDVDLIRRLKIKAIEEDTTATELLERYIKKGLNEKKHYTDKSQSNNGLMDLAGIGRSEEKTNAVQLKKELYK